jgi:putative PEP-CTERM system TPR-repeat lipoprotein
MSLSVAVLAAAAAVAGCAGDDAATYVASAKRYVEKSDYKAALIEVKNALQKDPENAEARLLLATSLLETADARGAEAEVRKAIALNAPPERAYPLLARTLIAQGEFWKLTDELGTRQLENPAARSDLEVSLAIGYFAQNDPKRAQSAAERSLADNPNNVRALLLQAQIAGGRNDAAAARGFVDSALKVAADDVEALMLKAELELADGKRDAAMALLEQAVAAHPQALNARFRLLSLAVTSGKLDVAKAQLAKMKEVQQRDIRTVYADALVAYVERDNARARDAVQLVLAGKPDHLPSLLLLGLANAQLGAYEAAEEPLRRVLAKLPGDLSARRALSTVYLHTGRAKQALETIDPALRARPDDPALLRTAGEAYLASGDPERATQAYERATALDKTDTRSQVRLAQVRLAAGDTTRAFNDLESLADKDAASAQAELALFSAHLRRGEYDKALAAVDALEKKQPKSGLPPSLRGVVYLAKRDMAGARRSFERALELAPTNSSAAYNLALIDMREGKPEDARRRYEAILAKDPKNELALLASAELRTVTGGSPAEYRAALDKIIALHPTSIRARATLVSFLARQRDAKGMVAAAQAAVAAIPNQPQLIDALANSQLLAGEANQAVDTYKQLVKLQPDEALGYLKLAEAQNAVKDYAGAIDSARRALALKPDFAQAWASLAKTYLASGRADAAIAEARKLQKERPDKALGYALEGEVLAAQKKWPEAAGVFKTALAKQPASLLAARQFIALQQAGKNADAAAMADKWIKDHPDDIALVDLRAQQNQQRKNFPAAVEGYKRVIEIDSDNVRALNNLAWILMQTNDPKALEYAERAHQVAPFNPSVLDTLGLAYTKSGDAKRGVTMLRMATTLAPANGEIRLHLAQALVKAGDKPAARKELAELTKLDKKSPIRVEAEQLQSTL